MIGADARFRGISQLLGEEAFRRVQGSTVCVVGLGGVGSWVVEALARSGVGSLILVDLDDVCVTNINRQLQATSATVGLPKAQLLAERVRDISPNCIVEPVLKFFSRSTAHCILSRPLDLVVDTIDRVANKTLLIAECVSRGIPLVTTGSAGDRLDPSAVRSCDLSKTVHDPLLQIVRKDLRGTFGFPRGERSPFNIPCVYAPQQRNAPRVVCEGGQTRRSCNDGLGSAVFVTGAVGFMAASVAVRALSEDRPTEAYPWHRKRREALAGSDFVERGNAEGDGMVVARRGNNLKRSEPTTQDA